MTRVIALCGRLYRGIAETSPNGFASELAQDIFYAVRSFASSPGFTVAAALAVGLGIGMSAVVYSSIDSLMLRPAAGLGNPESLIAVRTPVSFPAYEKIRDEGQLSDLACYLASVPLVLGESKPSKRITGQIVSPNYFRTVGV